VKENTEKFVSLEQFIHQLSNTSNRSILEILRKEISNGDRIFQLGRNIIDSIDTNKITNQKIQRKIDIISNQEVQIVNGFNNNVILQNKALEKVVESDTKGKQLVSSLKTTISAMESKLIRKLTNLLNAYLENIKTIKNYTQVQDRLEIDLNQTQEIINRGFVDLKQNDKSYQNVNISAHYKLQYERLKNIETGMTIQLLLITQYSVSILCIYFTFCINLLMKFLI
jgi:hypothetical protein